ncbi:DUF4401 domain-containing protein [Fusobacterium sp.]|uniref:DUF4401 domain-containing protein n=1 Tax=Fusobacterium sp. TaxID=68766 RepID=UPI0028FF6287|nr:DUF4401 domain-containing protein [Fusobacterium sp.]MDU1909812.1 DUF4401 domain-containing protein [Fusobacterium sp.]
MLYKLKNSFLYFSILFIITGVSCFIAYNWNKIGNFTKMSIPMTLIILGIIGWFIFQNKKLYRELSLFSSSFFIGTLFAVFGQIYQTGADPYTLFRNWGIFILIFSFIEKFYPLWTLNITVFTISGMLYMRLYGNFTMICITGSIIILFFFLIYIAVIKKMLIEVKDWFFYILAFSSTALMTAGIFWKVLGMRYYRNFDLYGPFYLLIYVVFIGLLFLLGKKVIRKQGLNIISIVSMTFVISSYIIREISGVESGVIGIFLIICLIIGSIRIITKNYLSSNSVRVILNFFKVILVILTIAFFSLLMSFFSLGEEAILVAGALLLTASCFLPKILKFKEEKNEIITFVSGLTLILVYLQERMRLSTITIVGIGWLIYGGFYILRHSKILDFLIVPAVISGLIMIFPGTRGYSKTLILVIPLIFILVSCCNEKMKIAKTERIKRITRGAEIIAFIQAIVVRSTLFRYNYYDSYIVNGIILAIALGLLYKIFAGKNYFTFFIIAVLVGFLSFFCLGMYGVNLGIMLILLYMYRDEKYMIGAAVIFLGGEISFYYYSLHITLLEKSYLMIKSSVLLFLGFLILSKITYKAMEKGEEL